MLLNFVTGEVIQKDVGFVAMFGVFEDHGALTDLKVGDRREADKGTRILIFAAHRKRLGDKGELGVAAEGELRGLCNGLCLNEMWRQSWIVVQLLDGCQGCSAIGRVVRVGDGDALDVFALESVKTEGLEGAIFSLPEHEYAPGVGSGVGRVGLSGSDDAFGEGEVSGEEEICRCAVDNLFTEGGGGAEAHLELDACTPFKIRC